MKIVTYFSQEPIGTTHFLYLIMAPVYDILFDRVLKLFIFDVIFYRFSVVVHCFVSA